MAVYNSGIILEVSNKLSSCSSKNGIYVIADEFAIDYDSICSLFSQINVRNLKKQMKFFDKQKWKVIYEQALKGERSLYQFSLDLNFSN